MTSASASALYIGHERCATLMPQVLFDYAPIQRLLRRTGARNFGLDWMQRDWYSRVPPRTPKHTEASLLPYGGLWFGHSQDDRVPSPHCG